MFERLEARLRGLHKIHRLSDAGEVIRAINGLMDWSIHHILLDIKDMSSEFDVISFSHIPRILNGFANELVKNSYESNCFAWMLVFCLVFLSFLFVFY